jgi:DNA-binding IclR family transcriptional regulator
VIIERRFGASWPNFRNNSNSVNANSKNYIVANDKGPTAFKSVFRTANILTCLSNGIESITDIASTCKLNKSTVYRLLKALCEAGLTMRDPLSRRYYIGPLITEIASNPQVTHEYLITCAFNEMRALSNISGESIGLNILLGLKNVLLYEIPSTYDLQIVGKNRVAGHLHAGANSKLLLLQLNKRELSMALNNMVLEPLTPHTVTDEDELMARLKQIKRQGYAVECGERIEGAMNIAVPIKNYVLPATLGILGPENRMKNRANEFINELLVRSARISHNLSLYLGSNNS